VSSNFFKKGIIGLFLKKLFIIRNSSLIISLSTSEYSSCLNLITWFAHFFDSFKFPVIFGPQGEKAWNFFAKRCFVSEFFPAPKYPLVNGKTDS
jgi:hypothetical protein